jgi:hypothetical protein
MNCFRTYLFFALFEFFKLSSEIKLNNARNIIKTTKIRISGYWLDVTQGVSSSYFVSEAASLEEAGIGRALIDEVEGRRNVGLRVVAWVDSW